MPHAARVGDYHSCPQVTGNVKHDGGIILKEDQPEVLIGYLHAARKGDHAGCVGVMDQIDEGAATVLIGGKPAARVNDKTKHKGGKIDEGCPTVHIGDTPQAASFLSSSAPLVQRCDDPKAPPSV
jgi:uncharacterized Zn-binding protein involved in type VI secretion